MCNLHMLNSILVNSNDIYWHYLTFPDHALRVMSNTIPDTANVRVLSFWCTPGVQRKGWELDKENILILSLMIDITNFFSFLRLEFNEIQGKKWRSSPV